MMYLLDTNVISEIRKIRLGKANLQITTWTESVHADDMYISAITSMELELGVVSMEQRDAVQAAPLRAWLEHQVLTEFSKRTLAVDSAVAQRCARLHVPDKRNERDALIAATALVHGMTIVTRNVVDFQPTEVPIINPWQLQTL